MWKKAGSELLLKRYEAGEERKLAKEREDLQKTTEKNLLKKQKEREAKEV